MQAHPVIYKNGWVYWGQFFNSANKQRVSYTFHPRFSIEAYSQFYKETTDPKDLKSLPHYRDYHLGLNILLKRWLFNHSQGNVYTSISGGYFNENFVDHSNLNKGNIFQSRLEMDWESRKLYTALNITSYFFYKKKYFKKFYHQISYQFGFAPYVAGMDELQTWMILKVDYLKWDYFKNENTFVLTPLMRFFYKNTLWEIGGSLMGGFFINLMVHY